jgi:hypothetical protein
MPHSKTTLICTLVCCVLTAQAVRGAGEMGEAKHKDEGVRFFGFVKDAAASPSSRQKSPPRSKAASNS